MAVSTRTLAVPVFVMLAALCLISGSTQHATAAPEGYQRLTAEQLDELLGPIALYPDLLLAQMLPAATYPTEITAAAEWVKTKGGEGLDAQNWDDTVKSVARYPEVLAYMNDNPEWTTALGQAFINQRADVMDSIQQLRAKAKTTGALTDTAQQKVVNQGEYIIIQPAQPDVIYVPQYNPDVVYVQHETPWAEPFLTFGAGLLLGSWLDNDWYWPSYGLYHGGNPYWNWNWNSGHYHGWGPRGHAGWPGYGYPHGGYTGYHPGGHPGHWRNPSWAGGQRYGGHGRGGEIPTGFEGGPGGRGPGRGPGVGGGPGGRGPGQGPGVGGGPRYRPPGRAPSVGGGVGGRQPAGGPGISGRPGGGPAMGAGRRTGRTGTPPRAGQTVGGIGAPYTRPPSGREFGRQGGSQGGAFGDYGRGSTATHSGARGRQSLSRAGGSLQSPTGRSAFGSRPYSPGRSSGVQRPASFGSSRMGGSSGRMGGSSGRMGGSSGRMGGSGGRMGGSGGRTGGGRH
ncbi:MAG: DUF3300 domain-containing protein [Bacteroidota bacterium]